MKMKDTTNLGNMKMNTTASSSYSSSASYRIVEKSLFNGYWNRLQQLIDWEICKDPYDGLRIAELGFKEPYLRCADYEVLAL